MNREIKTNFLFSPAIVPLVYKILTGVVFASGIVALYTGFMATNDCDLGDGLYAMLLPGFLALPFSLLVGIKLVRKCGLSKKKFGLVTTIQIVLIMGIFVFSRYLSSIAIGDCK